MALLRSRLRTIMYSARCPGKTTRSRSQPSHVEGPETKSVCLCNLSSQDGLGSWSGRTSPKPMKAKKKHLKVTLKRQATYLECGCSSCFCLAYCHTIPHARKKYPKCAALAGCSSLHPPGFKTIEDAFKWPHIFLQRISHHYGAKWLCERLQAWKWNFSSAFSGIGAPESAQC